MTHESRFFSDFFVVAFALWSALALVLAFSIMLGFNQRRYLPAEPINLVHANCTTGRIGLFTSTPHLDERMESGSPLVGSNAFKRMRFDQLGVISPHNVHRMYVALDGVHIIFTPDDALHRRLKLDDHRHNWATVCGLDPHAAIDSKGRVHLTACFHDKPNLWSIMSVRNKLADGPWSSICMRIYYLRSTSRPVLICS